MSESTCQLVEQCLIGDQYAMRALVEKHYGQVFGLCLRMLRQRQDAEDVAQETFVRVLRSLDRWDSSRSFEPWLLAIAGNRCRTALQARRHRCLHQTLVESPACDRHQQDEDAEHLAEEVELAMRGLRDEYRQAFLLFHQHELSYAEIAAQLDCPVGTVKTWIHRARLSLIDQLRRREVLQESG